MAKAQFYFIYLFTYYYYYYLSNCLRDFSIIAFKHLLISLTFYYFSTKFDLLTYLTFLLLAELIIRCDSLRHGISETLVFHFTSLTRTSS